MQQIRKELCIVQYMQTELTQLRLAANRRYPKLTSSRKLNYALYEPLDSPSGSPLPSLDSRSESSDSSPTVATSVKCETGPSASG